MSTRLAAAKKGEFYPTPDRLLPFVAALAHAPSGGTLLDPCAGDGIAAAALGAAWGVTVYGNELATARADDARARLHGVTVGSYDTLVNDGATVSALFLNPPYGAASAGVRERRRETAALETTIEHLMPGGLCLCLIPLRVAMSDEFLTAFARHCVPVGLARFPEPEFTPFQQVALWGVRRALTTQMPTVDPTTTLRTLRVSWRAKDEPTGASIPVLGEWPFVPVEIPVAQGVPRFANTGVDPEALAARAAVKGATTDARFRALTAGVTSNGERLQATFTPLLPLKRGHAAELLAAGFLDGAELTYLGRACLVRGTARTKIAEHREEDAERDLTRVTRRERAVTVLTFVDAETGALTVLDAERDREAYEAFIIGEADALIRIVQERYPAHYEPGASPLDARVEAALAACRGPRRLFDLPDAPLPIQADAARAVAAAVRAGKRAVVVSGECGTGKTTIGALAWAVTDVSGMARGTARAVVMAPGHLTKKWAREATRVLGAWNVEAIQAKTTADVDRAFHAPHPTLLIMSQEAAKFGMKWVHVGHCTTVRVTTEVRREGETVTLRELRPVVRCPDCGVIQCNDKGDAFGWTEDERAARRVPAFGSQQRRCQSCVAALWQVVPYAAGRVGRRGLAARTAQPQADGLAYGGGKIALASHIATRYAGRFTLLCDESHEMKSADSDRGIAFGRLAGAAHLAVGLTGTLYGGRASSLFYLSYRFFREFRAMFTLADCDRFVTQYGLMEEIAYEDKHGQSSRTSTYGYTRLPAVRRREIPGARPELVALLLPHTLFLDLEDLGVALPSYDEYRLTARLPEAARGNIARLEAFKQAAVAGARQGDYSGLSKWMQAALGWPFAMEQDDALSMTSGATCDLTALHIPSGGFPLDQQLVAFAVAQRAAGRRVLIYVQQMNRRDPSPRLERLFLNAGLRVATLRRTSCKREDREEYVADCVTAGCDVLLTQPTLVQTGMDLLDFSCLVFLQPDVSTYRGRQASRRSWRLGQTQPVVVLYAVYAETLAAQSLALVAKKMRAADRVDGRLAEGLAASANDDEGDLLEALMRQVMTGRAGDGGGFAEYPVELPAALPPARPAVAA